MQRFLLKTEPSEYSFDDLLRDTRTVWTGVSNPTALIHIRTMKQDDEAFVYHTGSEKCIVGIAVIASDPYPDPSSENTKLAVFELRPLRRLENAVPLSLIKQKKEFNAFPLVTNSRLSVMPVAEKEWKAIISLSRQIPS
jgi:predicted RNA-binding protein with PUA-like domain